MVVEARGSVERAAATAVDCHLAGRFLSVVSLEFFQMRPQFLVVGPAVQVIADHCVGSLGRLASSPQADQHTGDDRTIGLDLHAYGIRAQQMSAA